MPKAQEISGEKDVHKGDKRPKPVSLTFGPENMEGMKPNHFVYDRPGAA